MTELAAILAQQTGTELPQTLLFDHPTIRAVATILATTVPSETRVSTTAIAEKYGLMNPVAGCATVETDP